MSVAHVKLQVRLEPGESRQLPCRLAPGPYRVRTLEPGPQLDLEVEGGLTVDDIGLWELNEAFAVQVLYCAEKLGIDPAKLNFLMPWSAELPEECRKPRHS